MNTERLIRLADKLEGKGPYEKKGPVPNERLDMQVWGQFSISKAKLAKPIVVNGERNLNEVIPVAVDLPCGTAACAMGWAGSDPWFRKRGLYTGFANGSYAPCVFLIKKKNDIATDYSAAATFFDITWEAASMLFSQDTGNSTPKQVAKNIRKFVKKNENTVP